MSPSRRILVALVAGLAAGALCARVPALAELPRLVAPVGQLWLRALQMTIIPLVVALVITGITSAAPSGMLGRQGARLIALFAGLLVTAGAFAMVIVQPMLVALPFPSDAGATFATTPAVAASAGGVSAWVDAVLPSNVVRAAAEGAMLPLVAFALLFALALTRVAPASRAPVTRFFRGLADAMLVLVGWVLQLAPFGVFAIAMQLVGSIGVAVGAVAYYLALNVVVMVLMLVLLYPMGARGAGVSLRAFAQALLPAQAIAATTRSSIASLPAMLDTARALGVRESTAGFVLPLAVALFRITTPPTVVISTIFAARFHGVALDLGMLVLLVLASAALSAGVVGVPGQASYFVTRLPMFAIAGVPLDLLGPLLAVDVIPDTFRTFGNVTADVAVTTLTESSARVPDAAPGVREEAAA